MLELELELELPVDDVDVVKGGQGVGQVLLPVLLVVTEDDVGGGSVVLPVDELSVDELPVDVEPVDELPVDELPVLVVLPVEWYEVVFVHLDVTLELVKMLELCVDSGMLDDVVTAPVVVL